MGVAGRWGGEFEGFGRTPLLRGTIINSCPIQCSNCSLRQQSRHVLPWPSITLWDGAFSTAKWWFISRSPPPLGKSWLRPYGGTLCFIINYKLLSHNSGDDRWNRCSPPDRSMGFHPHVVKDVWKQEEKQAALSVTRTLLLGTPYICHILRDRNTLRLGS